MIENLYTPGCIRTVSGQYVNLADPQPETILIEDIAHGLSRIARFNGQLPRDVVDPYSVAHHCILVAEALPPEHRFEGLMHDASEAYLGDCSKPLKALLPEYRKLEDRMMRVIAKKFGFDWPLCKAVKAMDTWALELEWNSIMLARSAAKEIPCMRGEAVQKRFMELFNEYTNALPASDEVPR